MNELLAPDWQDITEIFKRDFEGMTASPVTIGALVDAVKTAHKMILKNLTESEKKFLIFIIKGMPQRELAGLKSEINLLPGLHWKPLNIKKMPEAKQQAELGKLKKSSISSDRLEGWYPGPFLGRVR